MFRKRVVEKALNELSQQLWLNQSPFVQLRADRSGILPDMDFDLILKTL